MRLNPCEICCNFDKHLERANISRNEYSYDSHLFLSEKGNVMQAVDMQKVIMLPRMPGVKRAVFTRRIVAFNMTFATLGGRRNAQSLGIIWHEAVCGRNDEDVTSTYVKFVKHYKRDCHTITLWVDNCSAQNKNWTLFTTLCQLVNDPTNKCETITLKYFEPGHTFMAADAFHKRVEDEMRKMKNVLDFEDFKNCIAAQGIAIEMSADDFYDYKVNSAKQRLICN